jgi:hypothetical protein
MSLIRWQPQSGLACLSIKMVRFVKSGRRLPAGAPLGLSISPAGPSCSNFFFQTFAGRRVRSYSFRICSWFAGFLPY